MKKVMFKKMFSILLLGFLVVSCNLGKSNSKTGSVAINLSAELNRTLVPALSMDPVSYDISGTGPEALSFSQTITETQVTVEKLAFGEWTVSVLAKNADGTVIGSGTASVIVHSNTTESLTLVIKPLTDPGMLDLSLNWNIGDVESPEITAKLTPNSGADIPLNFSITDNSAQYSGTNLPYGYHTLTLQLFDNGALTMGTVEIVRIVSGQVTNGVFTFDKINKPGGNISFNINVEMDDVLNVTVAGLSPTKPSNIDMPLTASVANSSGNHVFTWYVNGNPAGIGETFNFNNSWEKGFYKISATAYTADGLRAGSVTSMVEVVDPVVIADPFTTSDTISTISRGAYDIADIDNNGLLDVIAVNSFSQTTLGTFTALPALDTNGKDLYGAGAGDLNNDNYPDFLTTGPNGASDSHNAVHINNAGTISTTGTTTYASNSVVFYGQRVTSADLNSDNYDDVVWFSTGGDIYVGISDGSGGFTGITKYAAPVIGHGHVYGYEIVDVDNDGDLDIICNRDFNTVAGDGDGSIDIFINDGNTLFTPYQIVKASYAQIFTGTLNPFGLNVADFNSDGKNDLIFYNVSPVSSEQGLWLGIRTSENGINPVYTFSKVDCASLNSSKAFFIKSSDYNNDNSMDLIISHQYGIILLTGSSTGDFTQKVISSGFSYKSNFIDINNDGKLDIIGDAGSNLKVWYQ